MNLVEDVQEQFRVAIDQIQARFVGLAPQAGGDQNDVRLRNGFVASGLNSLIGHEGRSMKDVESLAFDLVAEVDQRHLADHSAALKGEGSA